MTKKPRAAAVRPLTRQRAPGAGRPPAGDNGQRVRDLPGLMLRLPVDTLARLKALSKVRDVPIWRLVDAAVRVELAGLRGGELTDVSRLAKRETERLQVRRETAS